MKDIITKQEAKRLGFSTYYTGIPCKNGHDSERLINGNCAQCNREWQKNNRAKVSAARKLNKSKRVLFESRLTASDWDRINKHGGVPWIRLMLSVADGIDSLRRTANVS